MDVDRHLDARRGARQAVVDAELVDVTRDRYEVAEHRIADRRRDFRVRQRIQADIDHGALPDDLHPVEDRARVGEVRIVRRQQLRDLAGGQLLQQRQERCDDLVEVRPVVAHRAAQAVEHRVVDAHLRQVLLQRDDALLGRSCCAGCSCRSAWLRAGR
jgi:hypothetical protein